MLATPTYTRRFRNKKQQTGRTATRKLVCFTWGNESFAIAIEQTQYILTEFTPYGTLENGCSLVRHNHDTITLIDLSPLFPNGVVTTAGNYLIVCTVDQQTIGIAVNQIPMILEVTTEQFSAVPAMYQQRLHTQAIDHLIQPADGAPIFYVSLSALCQGAINTVPNQASLSS